MKDTNDKVLKASVTGKSRIDDTLKGLHRAKGEAEKAMEIFSEATEHSNLKKLFDEQDKIFSNIKKKSNFTLTASSHQPDLSELRIPPNPALETNERLANMEEHFQDMHKVSLNAAEIATEIQKSAAIFLEKFESAALTNERSSKRAILLSMLAMGAALIMPLTQIAYTEFWRVPQDSAANNAVISNLKSEIRELNKSQSKAPDIISETLKNNDQKSSEILLRIERLLTPKVNKEDQ